MGSPPPLPQHELSDYDHGSAQFDEILKSIPPVDFCFAYGSGVFDQHGYHDDDHNYSTVAHKQATTSRGDPIILPKSPSERERDPARQPMLDLVLAVRNPIEWHRENLARNWKHYSVLRYLGAERLGQIEGKTIEQEESLYMDEDHGAAMYYNTAIPVPGQPGRVMKYGIISMHALREDLLDWRWMYAAGRLQKPVRVIKASDALTEAHQANLASATRAALLLLPETFSDFDLFTMIAGLSYRGDFRMTFGENPQKVKNIVTANLPHFHRLYTPHVLSAVPSLMATTSDRTRFTQDLSQSTRAGLLGQLPSAVRQHLVPPSMRGSGGSVLIPAVPAGRVPAAGEVESALRTAWEGLPVKTTAKMVKLGIHKVVARSSLTQGIKGIFTAGVWKALVYGLSKVNKYRVGMGKLEAAGKM